MKQQIRLSDHFDYRRLIRFTLPSIGMMVYASIILVALPFNVLQLLFQSFFVTAEKPKFGLAVTVSA